jgi:LytR cell envelope-related transcriptional attenuator
MALALVAALVVAGLGVYIVTRGDDSPDPALGGQAGQAPSAEPTLVALQVNGGPAPLLAVVGVPAEGTPFVMPLSSQLTVVVPGQGETSASGVAALPGESMRVALSNMTGVWIPDYAVLSLRDLAATVDAAGGLTVNLPAAYPTTTDVLGPGEITMTGAQVKSFLAGSTDDAEVRWEILLTALLTEPPPLVAAADSELDDVDSVDAALARARGAEVLEMPTERVTATIVVPVYPALDAALSDSLGTPMPVPAIVQNGSGQPGVGEAVAVHIVPAGFRVVLAQNAQSFDVVRTDVFANGPDHESEARAVKQALGVGRVRVAAVPSNVGDITIVVGKDFTA